MFSDLWRKTTVSTCVYDCYASDAVLFLEISTYTQKKLMEPLFSLGT